MGFNVEEEVNVETDFEQLKKDFINKKVASANQFLTISYITVVC